MNIALDFSFGYKNSKMEHTKRVNREHKIKKNKFDLQIESIEDAK